MLEDILEAVWTGSVNARHSTYLSSRAGLQGVAAFRYLDAIHTTTGPTFRYTTRLYRTAEIIAITRNGQEPLMLQTHSRLYYLHPSHDLTQPLTEQEVCANRSPCGECATLVHLGRGTYKVYRGGSLTCRTNEGEAVTHNLTASQQLTIMKPTTCSNGAVQVGSLSLRLRDFTVTTTGEKAIDALLLQKDIANRAVQAETISSVKTAHDLLNLRIAHDLEAAAMDVGSVVQDNSLQVAQAKFNTHVSVTWLAALTLLIFSIILLVAWRILAARRAGRAVTGNSQPTGGQLVDLMPQADTTV